MYAIRSYYVIEYHRDIGWIYLKGNVHTHLNNVDVYAEEAEFDIESQTGKLHNGTISYNFV